MTPLTEQMARVYYELQAKLGSQRGERWATWEEAILIPGFLAENVACMEAAMGAIPGWRFVPIEPTKAMLRSGYISDFLAHDGDSGLEHVYRAMLAAAPSTPNQEEPKP